MTEITRIKGFLLSRQWRDATHGIDLSFWVSTDAGPLRLLLPATEAVCFIDRDLKLHLPKRTRRHSVDLSLLNGGPVDALYFQQQRTLQELTKLENRLHESDVKPADRYLMERFVTATLEASGELQAIAPDGTAKTVIMADDYVCPAGHHLQMLSPRISVIDYAASLRTLSLDIETEGFNDRLYSIGGHHQDQSAVFMIGDQPDQQRDGYRLIFKPDERTLLSAFFDWLSALDPDIIIGWSVVNFDLNFLHRKCQALNVPFAFGRGGEAATVLQPGSDNQPRIARLPGRPVLDGIDLLKAGFWNFESYSLENVAMSLLGTGKLIQSNEDKLAEIQRLFRKDKPQLADYNFKDCELVSRIFDKADLLAFAIQRASITGLPIDRMGGSVAAFDHLYLPRLHRQGYVAPNINANDHGLASPGGYVLDSTPGLYTHVLLLDFKSLYPSIIRTFCIDPMGLAVPGDNPISGFLQAQFSRDTHILPGLISDLWAERDKAKAQHDAALSQAIKIIMNSFYGVLGSSGCRFHHAKLASSITLRGHDILTRTKAFIEDRGHEVIYGDTDSVFVHAGATMTEAEATNLGHSLTRDLNDWWTRTIQQEHNLPSYLDMEFETLYLKFLMPTVRGMTVGTKKRYAGLVRRKDRLDVIFKGLEAVRTDWTPLAREFQRELFKRIFNDEPFDDFVRETNDQLLNGQMDDKLVYQKRLRRKLTDYQRNVPPHVQAARKLQQAGLYKNTRWIRYVITTNGPEPIDAQQSAPDYAHYQEKQLAPAADSILQCLDTSFATITDAQMQMF